MPRAENIEEPKVIHDARIWITAASAVCGAIIMIMLTLHSFGVFGYDKRIAVLESNTAAVKESLVRIERNLDEVRNAVRK